MAIAEARTTGWHSAWETNVYSQGRQLNRYPHHAVVAFLHRHFGDVADRSRVKLLELGFGAGNNLWFAAREGFSVAGIEGSASGVDFARRRLAEDGLGGDLRVGDFATLPWPDRSFDLVVDRMALTCADRRTIASALNETVRVLEPGGRFFSMIYSDQHPDRVFGQHLGENTYSDFSEGYFPGLGTVHFCSRAEVDMLFGERFAIHSLVNVQEADEINGRMKTAYWVIECEREARASFNST